jgi:hypothetical protein
MKVYKLASNRGRKQFQSPCGEEVMKVVGQEKATTKLVSIPLRGRGNESFKRVEESGLEFRRFNPLAGKR